jgi:hypothetical protein
VTATEMADFILNEMLYAPPNEYVENQVIGFIQTQLDVAIAKERERCARIAHYHYNQESFFGNEYASQKLKEVEADIIDSAKWYLGEEKK